MIVDVDLSSVQLCISLVNLAAVILLWVDVRTGRKITTPAEVQDPTYNAEIDLNERLLELQRMRFSNSRRMK
jgi:hypothetical protein